LTTNRKQPLRRVVSAIFDFIACARRLLGITCPPAEPSPIVFRSRHGPPRFKMSLRAQTPHPKPEQHFLGLNQNKFVSVRHQRKQSEQGLVRQPAFVLSPIALTVLFLLYVTGPPVDSCPGVNLVCQQLQACFLIALNGLSSCGVVSECAAVSSHFLSCACVMQIAGLVLLHVPMCSGGMVLLESRH